MRDIGREGEREGVYNGDRMREDRKECWDRDRGVKKREGVHDGDRMREDRKGC